MQGVFPSLSKFSTLLFIACFPHVVYILFFLQQRPLGKQGKFVSLFRQLYWYTYPNLIPPKFCLNLLIEYFNVTPIIDTWYLFHFSTLKICIFGEQSYFSHTYIYFLHSLFKLLNACTPLYAICLPPLRRGFKEIKMDDKNKGIHTKSISYTL